MPHDDDALAEEPGSSNWPRRLISVVVEVAVIACLAVGLSPWLWIGERLLGLSALLVLVVAGLMLGVRRRPALAAACLLGLLSVAWPWFRSSLLPVAPMAAADTSPAVRCLALDARGWSGEDPGELVAAVVAAEPDLAVVLCGDDRGLADALGAVDGYDYDRDAVVWGRTGEAEERVVVGRLFVIAREDPAAVRVQAFAGMPAVALDAGWEAAGGRPALRLIAAAVPPHDHPRDFVAQAAVIDRLGESAAQPGPLVVVVPDGWLPASGRWWRLAEAGGLQLPEGGLPSVEPTWAPRPFGVADCVIATRGWAVLETSGVTVPGVGRRAVVVDLAPPADPAATGDAPRSDRGSSPR